MNEATWRFVRQHSNDDVRQLALRGTKDREVDFRLALQQIEGWQVARHKLPTWAALDGLLYPPHLSLEQCSSEQTARYKASVCQRLLATLDAPSSTTLIDLTGGLGVDFYFMAQAFDSSSNYVEQNPDLCTIAAHNFRLLGLSCTVHHALAADILPVLPRATVIFLDPARRDHHGGRTYGIADCTPNVLEMKDELLGKADFIVLKLSPMLDWRKAVQDLGEQYVEEVHIVSVQNECKELLVVMSARSAKRSMGHYQVYCVNDDDTFIFRPSSPSPPLHPPPSAFTYLYEPNASMMKAGCFAEVAEAYQMAALAPNSHLFVSDRLMNDFPGRRFQITAISSMNKQELKVALKDIRQANITVRNFPLSVAELRHKLHLADGGTDYLFATTLADGRHILIICQKLNINS